jgi:hypothetical protein
MNNYSPMMRPNYGPPMTDDGSMRPRPWLQPGFQAHTGGGMQPMQAPGMPNMHPNAYTGGGAPMMPQGVQTGGPGQMMPAFNANTGGGMQPQPMGPPQAFTGGGLPPQRLAQMGGGRGQFDNRLLGRGLMR